MEVTEGELVDLECRALGKPIPQVSWYKDGKPLKQGDDFAFDNVENLAEMQTESKLRIEQVDPALHDGKYTMVAENQAGEVQHDIMLLGKISFL